MNGKRMDIPVLWLAAVFLLAAGPAVPVRAELDGDSFRARTQRNPFALPRGVYYKAPQTGTQTASKKKETKPAPAPPLVLQGVVWGGPEPVAVINGDNFVVGEAVAGHEVLDIGRDHVVVMGKKKTVTLRLDPTPLQAEISR